jgi:hypothetical protein
MQTSPTSSQRFSTFREFYPFYLSEHRDRNCRRMHFIGSSLAIVFVVVAIVTRNPWWLLTGLLSGYGFAWIGHFVFEKNKPASFKQPLFSFIGDWAMYRDVWARRIKL